MIASIKNLAVISLGIAAGAMSAGPFARPLSLSDVVDATAQGVSIASKASQDILRIALSAKTIFTTTESHDDSFVRLQNILSNTTPTSMPIEALIRSSIHCVYFDHKDYDSTLLHNAIRNCTPTDDMSVEALKESSSVCHSFDLSFEHEIELSGRFQQILQETTLTEIFHETTSRLHTIFHGSSFINTKTVRETVSSLHQIAHDSLKTIIKKARIQARILKEYKTMPFLWWSRVQESMNSFITLVQTQARNLHEKYATMPFRKPKLFYQNIGGREFKTRGGALFLDASTRKHDLKSRGRSLCPDPNRTVNWVSC